MLHRHALPGMPREALLREKQQIRGSCGVVSFLFLLGCTPSSSFGVDCIGVKGLLGKFRENLQKQHLFHRYSSTLLQRCDMCPLHHRAVAMKLHCTFVRVWMKTPVFAYIMQENVGIRQMEQKPTAIHPMHSSKSQRNLGTHRHSNLSDLVTPGADTPAIFQRTKP